MNLYTSSIRFARRAFYGTLLVSSLTGFITLPGYTHAQESKTADATEYTIHKPIYKKGELNRYKMAMNMLINSGAGDNEVNIAIRMKQATKEAKEDGSYTILQEFEEAKVTVGGMEQDMTSSLPKLTLTRDKEGKFGTKSEGGEEQASQITTMLSGFGKSQEAFYPTKPVKIGDTWKVSFNAPDSADTKTPLNGEATLLKSEIVGGVQTLAIKVVSDKESLSAQGVKGTNERQLNIVPETGKLIRMTVNSNIEAQATTVKMKMEMNLLPKEEKNTQK